MSRPITDAGWVRQHEEGRKAVQAALAGKVKTSYVENVAEGADAERVIRDLAQQGNKLIFTPELRLHGADAESGAATSPT